MTRAMAEYHDFAVREFVGSHPVITMAAVLASTGEVQELAAGTVLGKVTASKKYVVWDASAGDGSEIAATILGEDVTVPAAGDEAALRYVHGEFRKNGLTWDPDADEAAIDAAIEALASKGIYVK
ncbi:head decoration protein [Pseudodesulfovibrio tunisiensis]|uniref:head decoration protein n=1 Tax=Pseudodesulfovibrio tunisiensis TaxID=463192 RepID=UPI001FB43EAC|nr:head decoration protein [Pseudodesulfovibrio tunisiensis]